jgi:hypothetical protein
VCLGKETIWNFGMESFVEGVVGKRRKIRETIIKKNLRHAGYEDEKWIKLAQDRT